MKLSTQGQKTFRLKIIHYMRNANLTTRCQKVEERLPGTFWKLSTIKFGRLKSGDKTGIRQKLFRHKNLLKVYFKPIESQKISKAILW